jgi:hypothetical protein
VFGVLEEWMRGQIEAQAFSCAEAGQECITFLTNISTVLSPSILLGGQLAVITLSTPRDDIEKQNHLQQ